MKKQLITLIAIFLPMLASADAVEIDGIYYNLIPKGKATEVTKNPNNYLGDIVLPESVRYNDVDYSVIYIGDYAFYKCSGLTSVTIGSGIETIGSLAFASCPDLTDVYCYAKNVPSTNNDAFEGSYIEYATLYVPAASVSAYQAIGPKFYIIPSGRQHHCDGQGRHQ